MQGTWGIQLQLEDLGRVILALFLQMILLQLLYVCECECENEMYGMRDE